MLEVFSPLKGLLKIDHVCIDNNVFQFHYKLTVYILLLGSILVTSRQYFGDPINCVVDGIPNNIMDSYCWIYSTFTVPNWTRGQVGRDMVQPGVSNYVDGKDPVKYHKYYQWVCFALFFQAIFFYFPRYLWKMWEAGRMKSLVLDLNCSIVSDPELKEPLINYFVSNLHMQNFYALRFFLCELLNLFNVLAQLYFMDLFLDGEFSRYGYDVLSMTELKPEERTDTMSRVFPKVTKCTFHKYGPTGTIQKLDGLCVLPLNILNEKIYVFLWFWFRFIAIISSLNILYRIVIIMIPSFRVFLLKARTRLSYDELKIITQKCQIGDWFVLYQLAKNISPLTFKELVSDITRKIDCKDNV